MPELSDAYRQALTLQLSQATGLDVYASSIQAQGWETFFLARGSAGKMLGVLAMSQSPELAAFDLSWQPLKMDETKYQLGLGPTSPANAAALRERLPHTKPTTLGLDLSAGLGDRLGIATPGHIRAMRHNMAMRPILAQQSIREMERTLRTPQNVIDDATWGVFQEGWTAGYGADADHLMTPHDIDICADAGFTMYTFDPRYHVDNEAETEDIETLREKAGQLPWDALGTTADASQTAFTGAPHQLGDDLTLAMDETQFMRAACKYGRALAHIKAMYEHLVERMGDQPYEVEVSVDETDTPTRPIEHFYIASELRRLGVKWVSLAPRYIGRFEKGVDYIGDLDAFRAEFAQHAAIAKAFGPYKLSLHSGSDKFSIYPICAELAGPLVHLKTAGTSYLEALRAVARVDVDLFREVYQFAVDNYETDKATYHVSGKLANVPAPDTISDAELPDALDQFDTRQAFHVTFGTVLTSKDGDGQYIFRNRLYAVLNGDEETHYAALEHHLARHVTPFAQTSEG